MNGRLSSVGCGFSALLFLLGAYFASAFLLPESVWLQVFDGELGVVEWFTVLTVAAATGLFTFLTIRGGRASERGRLPKPVRVLYLLMAVAGLYFAGEEASWGQHWLGFRTPAAIAAQNKQGEFNLHNGEFLHDWLNEVPRTLASLFCLLICGVMPLVRWQMPGRRWWVPAAAVAPFGLAAALFNIPERVLERLNAEPTSGPLYLTLVHLPDEVKELLMGVVLLGFAVTMWIRWRRPRHGTEPMGRGESSAAA